MTTHSQLAVAALTFELPLVSSAGLQILPAGAFRARDGRPANCPPWYVGADTAARLIEQVQRSVNSIVIDYEHQTLNTEKNGLPAPAAGWFKQLEWRDGVGLFAIDTDWTAKAKAMIAAKEYRYLSPVFSYSEVTGEVIQILHVGLTNTPALDGMQEVALKTLQISLTQTHSSEDSMNPLLKAMLAALGLTDTINEADAVTAITALKANADLVASKDSEIAALTHKANQLAQKEIEIAALKATATGSQPDPAKFVPIEAVRPLQEQLAALSQQVQGREVDEVVTAALKDARLLPGQEAWARSLGTKDMASLKAYLANATPVAALKGMQSGGKAPDDSGELSVEQIGVCKALGLTHEDYKKSMTAA